MRASPHVADLELRAGKSVRVWLEARRSGRALVIDPDGRLLEIVRFNAGVTAPVSIIAHAGGRYRIELDDQLLVSRIGQSRVLSGAEVGRHQLAQRFLRAANDAYHFRGEHRRGSSALLRTVIRQAESIGDRRLAARGLVVLGDALRSSGRARDAVAAYSRAIARADDSATSIDARLGMALVFLRLDERDVAAMHARTAIHLAVQSGQEWRRAKGLTVLGRILPDGSVLEKELALYAEAIEILRQQRDSRSVAETLFLQAAALSEGSREKEALQSHRETVVILKGVSDERLLALELTSLGHSYANLGLSDRALDAYARARPLVEAMGDPFWTASLYGGLGFASAEIGDPRGAVVHYETAALENGKAGSVSGEVANLTMLGRALGSIHNNQGALEALERALALAEGVGEIPGISILLSHIAAAQASLGHDAKALSFYERALAACTETMEQRQCAVTLSALARFMVTKSNFDAARAHFEEALAASRESRAAFSSIEALMGLARLDRRAGHLSRALTRAEEAMGVVESLRANVDSYRSRSTYFATARELHELHMNVLYELHLRRPDEGFERLAFEAAEMARARSFVEELSGLRPSASASSLSASQNGSNLRWSLDAVLEEIDQVRELATETLVLEEWGGEQRRLATMELDRILSGGDVALISYFLGAERSFVWSVANRHLRMSVLPTKQEIERDAKSMYSALASHEIRASESAKDHASRVQESEKRFDSLARSLGVTLLAPVATALRSSRIHIVGDGSLHKIPFSALADPSFPSEYVPLMEHRDVVRLPSVASLALLRSRSTGDSRTPSERRLAVIADPVFDAQDPRIEPISRGVGSTHEGHTDRDAIQSSSEIRGRHIDYGLLPRLLASRDEARQILDLVPEQGRLAALGFDANRELVTGGGLDGFDVVHLATHGLYDNEHPTRSGIVFSLFDERGRPKDGFLGLRELRSIRLAAGLVVLSACRTALGEEIESEGPMGLVRAFFAAGARGVIASYWSVDDEATSELMKLFYLAMFEGNLDPARALSTAQRELRRHQRFRAPYFWAGFELHGMGT